MSNVASKGSGGGVYASKSDIALTGAEFTENQGALGGGWLSLVSSNVTRLKGWEAQRWTTKNDLPSLHTPNYESANTPDRSVSD